MASLFYPLANASTKRPILLLGSVFALFLEANAFHLASFGDASFARRGLLKEQHWRRHCLSSVTMMGRRRKGEGAQRSRWAPREVSSDFEVPQGVAENVDVGSNRLAKIEAVVNRRQSGLIVVLEDPSDAHNAGAVIRSCDAFGVTEVWFVHNGIKPGTSMRAHLERSEPITVETRALGLASASAIRWVECRTIDSTQDAIAQLKEQGYFSVATCFTERSQSMYQCDLTQQKLALWVGNEFAGLSEVAIAAADMELFIPMRGMIQSLNLSVATAICLNEISRQRVTNAAVDYALSEETRRSLLARLVMRRRGHREEFTAQKKRRLEKTWESLVKTSLNAGYAPAPTAIDYH